MTEDIDEQKVCMTLRDWFAGQALAGILARENGYSAVVAAEAYRYAEDMLKESNERNPGVRTDGSA